MQTPSASQMLMCVLDGSVIEYRFFRDFGGLPKKSLFSTRPKVRTQNLLFVGGGGVDASGIKGGHASIGRNVATEILLHGKQEFFF